MQQSSEQKPARFELNKTDISKFGFDLSSDKKIYQQLISPFEDDQHKPHPLKIQIPEGFTSFDFQIDKVSNRLPDDTFIYIFYNIIEERMQLLAARTLIERGLNYHKRHKIWVRKKEKKFQYFNINEWKYADFNESVNDEQFYSKEDFNDKDK